MKNNYEDEISSTRERRSRRRPSKQPKKYQREIEYTENRRPEVNDQSYFTGEGQARSSVKKRRNETGYNPDQLPKSKKSVFVKIIAMILVECLTLFGIFSYAYVARTMSLLQPQKFEISNVKNSELTVEDLSTMKGYWMIAIFGVDTRGSNVGKGTNSDVIMIACINQDNGDVKLVSVFRDSYLNISDKNSYNKINAAYAQGGAEQAVKALNKNLDLNITDYITFNWKAVADAINILGGIDLDVNKAEFRYINGFITETVKSTGVGSHHLKNPGLQHLDGIQAVSYARLRKMDNDYARTERQRKVIEKAFEKAKKADYTVLNNILVVVLPQAATSLDFGDLTQVALNISKYKLGESSGFPMARGEANMGSKGACVIPQTLETNVKELHKFLFENEEYSTTSTVKTISAKIAADTGMYKAGKSIGHVSTEGYIPKETTQAKTTEKASETSKSKWETDANGNIIWETDEAGRIIAPTDDSGESTRNPSIGETDEDGNLVDPEETLGSGRNPSNPSGTTNPTKPTVSGSGSPQETTKPTVPTSTNSSDQEVGPGVNSGDGTNPTKPSVNPTEPTTTGTRPNPVGPSIDNSDQSIGGSTVVTIPSGGAPNPQSGNSEPGGTSSPGTVPGP